MAAPIQPPKKKASRSASAGRSVDFDTKPVSDKAETPKKPLDRKDLPDTSISHHVRPKKRSGGKKALLFIMGIVVLVAIAGYLASVYFSRAAFTIVPRVVPFSVDSTYVAQNVPGKGALVYELATIKGDMSATVPATDGQKISTTAKGKITVYNGYSTQSQRLIAGTRFSDDSGKIYRLSSSIVIPGYTSSGSNIIPGSVTASIVADQPGQSYNIGKGDSVSDFKVVAYKGTPRYESIYARLASDVSGGFVGTKKTISPAVLASTTAALQASITEGLVAKLRDGIPSEYVMYPKAFVSTFASPVIGGSDSKSATVSVHGTVFGILFKRSELVSKVAGEQAVGTFDNMRFETPGLESLDFSIANAKDFSPEKKNTLIIKLKGEAALMGSIPVKEIKEKLAGLSLSETSAVFRSFKPVIEIEKSSGSVTPPWADVPNDPERIKVDVLTK